MKAKKSVPVRKDMVLRRKTSPASAHEKEIIEKTVADMCSAIDETVDHLTIEDLAKAVKDAIQNIVPTAFAVTFRNAGLAFNRSVRKAAKKNAS